MFNFLYSIKVFSDRAKMANLIVITNVITSTAPSNWGVSIIF